MDVRVWVRALTIRERVAITRAIPAGELADDVNLELARRRCAEWFPLAPRSDLAEEALLAALGVSRERLEAALDPWPPWLATVAAAYGATPQPLAIHFPGRPWLEELCGVIRPLLVWADAKIEPIVAQHPAARDSLRSGLAIRLLTLAMRAIVTELGAARLRGELHGETSRSRYHEFCARLAHPDGQARFLRDHPVLARDLGTAAMQWVELATELLGRLRDDRAAIRDALGVAETDLLVELVPELGDRHRNGRSVSCVRFASGARLIYKPRSVATEAAFARLVAWLDERGLEPALASIRILDRQTHGWVELVEPAPCRDRDQVARFYRRLGSLAGVLFALRVTDVHFENLIARGEIPLLLDLEASLQPLTALDGFATAREVAQRVLADSVLATGLFPSPPEAAHRLRVSGLEDLAGRVSATSMQLVAEGTDEMRFSRDPVELPRSHNVPVLDGVTARAIDHVEEIIGGLETTVRWLAAHRSELLADGGPLSWFLDAETRVIMRNTRTYQLLLTEGLHPAFLRDGCDRGRLLESLFRGQLEHPGFDSVVRCEITALERGDVPVFTTRPRSRAVTSERIVMADFFEVSGADAVGRRLAALSEPELARQAWLARAAVATLHRGANGSRARSKLEPARDHLARATAIGDQLIASAIRGAGDVTWLGLQTDAAGSWAIHPLSTHLYDGLPGVILFLAHLGRQTGSSRYTTYARAALRALHGELAAAAATEQPIGAFSGWGGLIYTHAHLGVLWGEPSLLDVAEGMLQRLPAAIEHDRRFDLMSGSAGCILALSRLDQARSSKRATELAGVATQHLLTHAVSSAEGTTWHARALSGLSHGAAGFAWALAVAAAITGDARAAGAARGALRFERSLYSPALNNWLDVREASTGACMVAWCNGAPGIALARLQIAELLPDVEVGAELGIALATASAHTHYADDCLCHGAMGVIDVLMQAGPAHQDAMLAMLPAGTWRCGTPMGVSSPGFMTGMSGIGYQLLRLHDPERVPSILALELPPRSE